MQLSGTYRERRRPIRSLRAGATHPTRMEITGATPPKRRCKSPPQAARDFRMFTLTAGDNSEPLPIGREGCSQLGVPLEAGDADRHCNLRTCPQYAHRALINE